jgi:flagellar hook-associated protein 3 FlgL
MKTTFVSTSALSQATRLSLMKAQQRLVSAEKEATTWRYADVGTSIGFRTGEAVSLRQDHARLSSIKDSNSIASTRMEMTQKVLEGLLADANSFLGTLLASRDSDGGPQVAEVEARTRLNSMINGLNTAVNGAYIFAGVNADVRPLAPYYGNPPSTSRQAVANAFFTEFGVSQTDPAAAGISATDMQAFLDTTFADLTADPAWSTIWSSASSQNVRSRISLSEIVETSTNANTAPMRDLISAYTMVADLGATNLNKEAYKAVIDTAGKIVESAIQKLIDLSATLGTAQERVKTSDERMTIQIGVLQKRIVGLEGVDPDEAATRVTTLLTQIETSYALTSRIQNLSLLNYI